MSVVRAEDSLDLIEKPRDVVADPALSERAEVCEVAPDLRRVDGRDLAEPRGGHSGFAIVPQLHEHTQIERKPLDDAFRNPVMQRIAHGSALVCDIDSRRRHGNPQLQTWATAGSRVSHRRRTADRYEG